MSQPDRKRSALSGAQLLDELAAEQGAQTVASAAKLAGDLVGVRQRA
jgi:hypothetical protein